MKVDWGLEEEKSYIQHQEANSQVWDHNTALAEAEDKDKKTPWTTWYSMRFLQ